MHRKKSSTNGVTHNAWVELELSRNLPAGAPINSVSAGRLSLLCKAAHEMLDYKIPEDIKARIPDYFYYALGGEYVSIAGNDALIRDKDGFCALEHSTGTAGYVAALRTTCRKLDMDWLFEYWDSLPWYHSDIFDGEIAAEVATHFKKRESANSYYRYLLKVQAEEKPSQCEAKSFGVDANEAFKQILLRLYNEGGCGAQEDFAEGWDTAISEAIRIVEQETGISIETVLDADV